MDYYCDSPGVLSVDEDSSPLPSQSLDDDPEPYLDDADSLGPSLSRASPQLEGVDQSDPDPGCSTSQDHVWPKQELLIPPDLPQGPVEKPVVIVKPKVPKYVVRPGPVPPPPKYVLTELDDHHVLDRNIWMFVFKFLPKADLSRCMRVCKTWNRWCLDPYMWRNIDLSHTKIRQTHLLGCVRRQPKVLNLQGSSISKPQLQWMIARLPHLKELNLNSNTWAAVNCLCSAICPLLNVLDLSWVSGVGDACVRDLVLPPTDHRPGVSETGSRLRRCSELSLVGANITDKTMDILASHLPRLQKLDLGYCPYVTEDGLKTLVAETSLMKSNIEDLGLVCLRKLTDDCFNILAELPNLKRFDLTHCPLISVDGVMKFIERSKPAKNFIMLDKFRIQLQ